MEIFIRQIETEDAEAIARLSGQLGYSSTTEETKDRIIRLSNYPDNFGYVAFFDNKIVAWIHFFLSVHIESEPFFEIGGLIVDEDYRGNGIGKQLVGKAILWCKNKGKYKLRVRCNVKRIHAHEFYNKLGFHETKESKIFEMNLTK